MTQNAPKPAPETPVVPPAPAGDASANAVGRRWALPHRIFPWLALLFGLPLVFLTAPFQVPDEPSHFYRAYQISEGHLRPVYRNHRGGGDLPLNLTAVAKRFDRLEHNREAKTSWGEIRDAARVPLEADRREFTPFVASIYSPASYVPQSIAILAGRHLGLGPLGLMYAGRVGNLLLWVALSGLALRLTPACRRPFLLLAMMPMTLFQAASLSADPVLNAVALLFTALVLRYARPGAPCAPGGEIEPAAGTGHDAAALRVGWRGLLVFAALALMLALTKFVYLTLLALLFLVPPSRFGGWRRYLAAGVLLGALALAASMAWTSQTEGLDTVVILKEHVSPPGQIHHLRDHPSAIVTVPAMTVWRLGSVIVRSFVGSLGWLDTPMSRLFTDVWLLALYAACWLDERRWSFPLGRLVPIVLIAVGLSLLATATLSYLYTTQVGAAAIAGVQGRYLIPLAPAVCVLLWGLSRRLPRPRIQDTAGAVDLATVGLICIGGVYTLLTVWTRYYGHGGRG